MCSVQEKQRVDRELSSELIESSLKESWPCYHMHRQADRLSPMILAAGYYSIMVPTNTALTCRTPREFRYSPNLKYASYDLDKEFGFETGDERRRRNLTKYLGQLRKEEEKEKRRQEKEKEEKEGKEKQRKRKQESEWKKSVEEERRKVEDIKRQKRREESRRKRRKESNRRKRREESSRRKEREAEREQRALMITEAVGAVEDAGDVVVERDDLTEGGAQ